MTHALRPWTIDFHVAQNDATVKGSGSHDKTGRHCLPNDPNGKLDIARHAGSWLRDDAGNVTRALQHICWDGCMFPNATMMQAGDVERRPRRDDRRARRAWVGLSYVSRQHRELQPRSLTFCKLELTLRSCRAES